MNDYKRDKKMKRQTKDDEKMMVIINIPTNRIITIKKNREEIVSTLVTISAVLSQDPQRNNGDLKNCKTHNVMLWHMFLFLRHNHLNYEYLIVNGAGARFDPCTRPCSATSSTRKWDMQDDARLFQWHRSNVFVVLYIYLIKKKKKKKKKKEEKKNKKKRRKKKKKKKKKEEKKKK